MCVACGISQVPVCAAAGPCTLVLQHFIGLAVIVGGSMLGLVSAWGSRMLSMVTSRIRLYAE